MLKVVVCVKQVPNTEQVKIDPLKHTLIRDGVENIMNPADREALEVALILKDKHGADVSVLTMGPPQAETVLQEAVALGADRGFLLSDSALGGSDCLATATALAAAIRKIGNFDLILCGQATLDGETAQVGPELAQLLFVPDVTSIRQLSFENGSFTVTTDTENESLVLQVNAPFLATVSKAGKELRYASIKGKMMAKKVHFPVWTVKDLNLDICAVGLEGSPTRVKKIRVAETPHVNGDIFCDGQIQFGITKAADLIMQLTKTGG